MFTYSSVFDSCFHGADLLDQNRRSTGHGSSLSLSSSAAHHHRVVLRSRIYIYRGSRPFISDIAEGLALVNLLRSYAFSYFRSSVINPYETRNTVAAATLVRPISSSGNPSNRIPTVKGQIFNLLCICINLGLARNFLLEKLFTVFSSPVNTCRLTRRSVSSVPIMYNTRTRFVWETQVFWVLKPCNLLPVEESNSTFFHLFESGRISEHYAGFFKVTM
ncbi:unnamed protein product [Arabis nemorensis]|uniref:Uncharacterized protein n=1 Tax=Arabis nemorensis TaxID=586526 RepID=A0A565BMY2_9BRAS|nr:unnamed protein product [Arabis nemorensis]